MRLDTFIKRYKPIKIHNVIPDNTDCSWWDYVIDNYYDAEGKIEINKYYGKYQVSTMVEDEGSFYIIQGYHLVNRMGYIFTEKILKHHVKVG